MRKTIATLVVVAAVAAVVLAEQATARRFGFDDFSRVVRVADPRIAPDGQSVAVVISRANLDENRYDPQLVLVDVAGGSSKTLVSGRIGLTHPRWSPDGQRLAFLAMTPSGSDARQQVFVLPRQGGEPRAVTTAGRGVQQFAWSPDSQTIAYAAADDAEKKTGPERFNDSFEIFSGDFLATAATLPTHVWTVPSAGGEARRLTSGTWTLPVTRPPGAPSSQLAWTHDGSAVTFTRQTPRGTGTGGADGLHVVNVSDGAIKSLNLRGTHPVYSPDGRSVAFLSAGVSVAPAAGGAVRPHAKDRPQHGARALDARRQVTARRRERHDPRVAVAAAGQW